MAFNLLIELPSSNPDWTTLNRKLVDYLDFGIEFFPMPASGIFSKNYLGMSIVKRELTDKKAVAIREVVLYLLGLKCLIFDLYSSSQVSVNDVELLIKRLH